MRLVHHAATRRKRRLEPRLDMLACDRHVDVHRVSQRLGLIELLHPHRRSVSERIDGIVVGHRGVAECSAQKSTSIASGFAAMASCTSWTAPRSATAPCALATAETARAKST